MKKCILYCLVLSFLIPACSTSKSSSSGGNNGNMNQQENTPTTEKKIEKPVISENTNLTPLKQRTTQERVMTKKKSNTNTSRTFEAAPSVPDSL